MPLAPVPVPAPSLPGSERAESAKSADRAGSRAEKGAGQGRGKGSRKDKIERAEKAHLLIRGVMMAQGTGAVDMMAFTSANAHVRPGN